MGDERKILECDSLGCESACCYGCKCCEARGKIIKEQEAKINQQQNQILGLLGRQTNLGSVSTNTSEAEIRRLKSENDRLRWERNQWREKAESVNQTKENLGQENKELREKVAQLEEIIREYESLTEEIGQVSQEVNNLTVNNQQKEQIIKENVKVLEAKIAEIKG